MKKLYLFSVLIFILSFNIFSANSNIPEDGRLSFKLLNCYNEEEFNKIIDIESNRIILPLIGEYKIKEKNINELEKNINNIYNSKYYNNSKIFLKIKKAKYFYCDGQINNPNMYSFDESITLLEAINKASGFTKNADRKKIILKRGISEINLDLNEMKRKGKDLFIKDGDSIYVMKKEYGLYIEGNIKKPGYYYFNKGEKLLDICKEAGNFLNEDSAFQAVIKRKNSIIIVDLQKLLKKGDNSQNISLYLNDKIKIKGTDYNDYIYVLGYVNNKGKKFYKKNISLLDILLEAEPEDKARLRAIKVIRGTKEKPIIKSYNMHDIMKSGKFSKKVFLKPGDIVYVPNSRRRAWENINRTLSNVIFFLGNLDSLEQYFAERNYY